MEKEIQLMAIAIADKVPSVGEIPDFFKVEFIQNRPQLVKVNGLSNDPHADRVIIEVKPLGNNIFEVETEKGKYVVQVKVDG